MKTATKKKPAAKKKAAAKPAELDTITVQNPRKKIKELMDFLREINDRTDIGIEFHLSGLSDYGSACIGDVEAEQEIEKALTLYCVVKALNQ